MTIQPAATRAAVLAALLAACIGASVAGPEEDHRVRGRAIAAQLCSECHVIGRASQPGAFAGPAFLRVANMPSTTGPALAVFLQSHHQRMPSVRLDRDEMDAVIDYILSLKARQGPNGRDASGHHLGGLRVTLPHPVLLADIGGTYVRYSILPEPGGRPGPIRKVPTAGFPGPVDAIRAYVDRQDAVRPRSAFLAVAGRITPGITRLTNAPWRFDPGGIGEAFGLEAVRLVNDYVPLAAAVTVLDPDDPAELARIGPAVEGVGPRLVLGPGTGLGAAVLIPAGDRLLIQTTEAGHIGFGPCEPDDKMPWSALMAAEGRLTVETLLSGPGLVRLVRALAATRGAAVGWSSPPEVLEGARSDPVAREAVHQFARLLGRFAGDMALVFSATGGVFLAGGIAPRIVDVLRGEPFSQAFEDKAPFREAMLALPRAVILHPEPAIDGLAALLADEDRFLFPAQDWRA